jgi:NAD(P)H-flavin reductase
MYMATLPEHKIDVELDPMVPQPYRIRTVRRETGDTFTFALVPVDTRMRMTSFRPGQFNMVYVFGKGEVPISISGDPGSKTSLVHTVRAVGAVTRAMCSSKRGDIVGIRGPFGSGWPVAAAEGYDILIIAGGIGLAPLRPALYHVLADRGKYGHVTLLYGARTPEEMLYVKELEKWGGRFDVDVEVTVDNADSKWYGRVGVVTTLISRARFDPDETVAMVCGPEIMMHFTVRELRAHGMDPENIYLSLERNMKCAIGFCGHCQYGPEFICKDGPVFPYSRVDQLMRIREL